MSLPWECQLAYKFEISKHTNSLRQRSHIFSTFYSFSHLGAAIKNIFGPYSDQSSKRNHNTINSPNSHLKLYDLYQENRRELGMTHFCDQLKPIIFKQKFLPSKESETVFFPFRLLKKLKIFQKQGPKNCTKGICSWNSTSGIHMEGNNIFNTHKKQTIDQSTNDATL